ncbi:MAG TPA: LLM class flavin-dependent oxidoreductase [Acidimicrobiia bacterium]|nr:LLM class flavin-dependent oxidoreductase [Acidimicrobiia bacterium]
MEFGLFCGGYVPQAMSATDPNAEHTRLMSEADLCVVGDQHNWKYAWLTEHHFLKEYSHISANEVLAPHILARTEKIHVGSGIINVTPPVNHPARVAERVAMLDHLSNGRFEFGTGRGSSTTEQAGFGITDPELTKEMYDEVIGEFKKMWRDDTYSFDGRFFTMPVRDVLPKPYVKPHPPMWVAAGNPGTFEKAAQLGLGVLCFTGGSPAKMAPLIDLYKKTIVNAEPVGEFVNDNIAVTTSFMCLESRDEARDLLTRSGNGRQQSLVFHYLDTFPKPPGVPDWPTEIPDPTLEQIEKGFETGASIVGTPDDCAQALQKWEDVGVDQLIMGPSGSVFPHDLLARTIALFGDEVIPRFDKDPEHSTSRYRREAAERLGVA